MRINREWATCVALATIPTIPFWLTVILPSSRLAERIFENSIADWLITAYIIPGIFAIASLAHVLVRITDQEVEVEAIFILGVLLSIIFWGTILHGLYLGYRKIRNRGK